MEKSDSFKLHKSERRIPHKPWLYSLRSRIFVFILIVIIVPVIFSYFYLHKWIDHYAGKWIMTVLTSHLASSELCLASEIGHLESITRAMSCDNTIKTTLRLGIRGQLNSYLGQLRTKNRVAMLAVTDMEGNIQALSPGSTSVSGKLTEHPLIREALKGFFLAGPVREENNILLNALGGDIDRDKPFLALESAFPIQVRDKVIGAILAALPVNGNDNLVLQMKKHAGTDAVAIVADKQIVATTLAKEKVFRLGISLIRAMENTTGIFRCRSKDKVLDFDCSFRLFHNPFQDPVAAVVVMVDHHKNHAILTRVNRLMAGVLGSALCMVLVLGLFVSRVISEPVSKLVNVMESFEKGDLDARVPVKRNDEIGQLAHGFNRMAERIAEHVRALHEEIASRIRAEKTLAEEKELLSVTLRSIGDGVISTDSKGRVVLMNKTAEELTGWKEQEAIGREFTEVFPIVNGTTRKPMENPVHKVLSTGEVVELANNTVLLARDGKERLIADSAAPVLDSQNRILGVVLVFRDVTEKYRLEEELARTYKLESLGVLAGGIAHDFNNLLTGIMGNLSLAKKLAGENLKVAERLDAAEKAIVRARDLAGQLLTFARGGAPVKEVVDIKKLIQETANFALAGTNVRCELEFDEPLWAAEVDYSQISQVIHNLIINARDAMPGGGIITVKCENCLVSEEENKLPLKPGKYLKIIVADQGHGIPERYLSRIFEPYFTRKKGGHGLGLSIVYSIVKRHEGHISVASKEGYGTTFKIYLPATEEKVEQKKISAVQTSIQRGGRVLVMDDDELVGDIAIQALEELGFEADLARDGTEAIELYKKAMQAGSPYLAVIMDITIPGGMGGKEAIKYLKEIDPQVKAIVSSGYANDPVMAQYKDYGFAGVLAKPYTLEALEDVLMTVLG